ncbi:MAG: hypothetical protein ACOCVG_01875 [Verrucomicrobiota bacterium]
MPRWASSLFSPAFLLCSLALGEPSFGVAPVRVELGVRSVGEVHVESIFVHNPLATAIEVDASCANPAVGLEPASVQIAPFGGAVIEMTLPLRHLGEFEEVIVFTSPSQAGERFSTYAGRAVLDHQKRSRRSITFEPFTHADESEEVETWFEDGMRWHRQKGIIYPHAVRVAQGLEGRVDSGSTHVYLPDIGSHFAPMQITTEIPGDLFTAVSIELGEINTLGTAGTHSAVFVGHKADGSTVSAEWVADGQADGVGGVADFEVFTFPAEFAGLTRLETHSSAFTIDNFIADGPPRPSDLEQAYMAWRDVHLPGKGLRTGVLEDFDGDGRSNLWEFMSGNSPTLPDAHTANLSLQPSADGTALRFWLRNGLPLSHLRLEHSTDLKEWQPIEIDPEALELLEQVGGISRYSLPFAESSTLPNFYRLSHQP